MTLSAPQQRDNQQPESLRIQWTNDKSATPKIIKCTTCGTTRTNDRLTHDPRFWVQSSAYADLQSTSSTCPWCAVLCAAVRFCSGAKSGNNANNSPNENEAVELEEELHRGYLDWGADVFAPVWNGGGKSMPLEIFVTDREGGFVGLNRLPVKKIVENDLDSRSLLRRVLGWLAMCENFHGACQAAYAYRRAPTRLISVGAIGEEEVRLVEMDGQLVDWLCLSYPWGRLVPDCITSKRNYKEQKKGIGWDTMPRTFQEAIMLTRRLGYRYLWIDSLTIIQDDEADWRKESARMEEYYGGALLTIAATSGFTSSDGLFYRKPVDSVEVCFDGDIKAKIQIRQKLTHLLSSRPNTADQEPLHLLSRGWVYQERLLSRRVLHFTPQELQWECMENSSCDCEVVQSLPTDPKIDYSQAISSFNTSSKNRLDDPKTNLEILAGWMQMVGEYTSLHLTEPTDKLPALSGLAKQYHSILGHTKFKYVAGIWDNWDQFSKATEEYNYLLLGLLWAQNEKQDTQLLKRPRQWISPTWSWASVDGQIYYPWKDRLQVMYSEYYISNRFADTSPIREGDLTGQIRSAHLSLQGPMVDAKISYKKPLQGYRTEGHLECEYDSEDGEGLDRFWLDYATFDKSDPDHYVAEGSTVQLLRVFHVGYGKRVVSLVLKEIEEGSGMYHRIGIADEFLRREYPPVEAGWRGRQDWPEFKGELRQITIL